ncbi:hypothetical protein AMECASPLE_027926 [Ameca splendens]|uniref:Secreted protein n=1 Tax=Ameca splendens TaxID=208324 RepID=A0ABV0YSD7_9TELE
MTHYLPTVTILFFICSFSIPASSIQGYGGAGVYLQWSTGKRQDTPWTTQDKQPCTPKDSLERPINTTGMFLDSGRKRSTRREPMHARGEHANSMQKDLRPGVEPRTFSL